MNKEKIDLKRVTSILNDTDSLSQEEKQKQDALILKHEQALKKGIKLKEELTQELDNNSINVNIEDLFKALSFEGKIIGLNETVKLKDAAARLQEKSQELQVKNAKNTLILFYINEKTSFFIVNDILSNAPDLTNTNLEFGYFTDNSLKEDDISYKVIVSGV